MVQIPLNPYPNQSFQCRVPVNGQNKNFKFELWYNEIAEYWLFSLYDVDNEEYIFSNFPLLTSSHNFYDILVQLHYKQIGICIMLPLVKEHKSQANDTDLGTSYIMIWGDNE